MPSRIGSIGGGASVTPGVSVTSTPVFPEYIGGPLPAPAAGVSGSGMSVTEVPMQAASWSCGFAPSLPPLIRQDMINGTTERDGFMLVWKGNVPEQGMDYSTALYAGIVDKCGLSDGLTLAGPGILAMVGSDDGQIAPRYYNMTVNPTNWFPGGDLGPCTEYWLARYGLTLGNAETTGGYNAEPQYVMGARQSWEKRMLKWDPPTYYEYEVAGTVINVGTPDFLWPGANVDVVLSDRFGNTVFGGKRAISSTATNAVIDASEHSTIVMVCGEGSGRYTTVAWGVGGGGVAASGLDGAGRPTVRLVDEPEMTFAMESSGLMDDLADGIAERFGTARMRHDVAVQPGIPARWWVGPGKKVESWYPNQQVAGDTSSVFAATPYKPVVERVTRISWTADPTHYTVGFFRSKTGTYTDVTEHLPSAPGATMMECATEYAARTLSSMSNRYGDSSLWTRIPS